MKTFSGALALIAFLTAACSDSNARRSDTASSMPNAGAGEKINIIHLDTSMRNAPGVSSPAQQSATQPQPNVIGEGRRGAEPPLNSSGSRDPMPPLTGETSKRGGTMPVAPPLRDSTRGPKGEIDSKGNIIRRDL